MREIKFRAWDKDVMRSWEELTNTPDGAVALVMAMQGKVTDCKLMQYTGLKDKNGKEIYEGDIISDSDRKRVIVWDEVAARYFAITKGGEDHKSIGAAVYSSKIIGNIYENPDLIDNQGR